MAKHLDIPVINAGDGMHEHPSQALLDAFTILKHKKSFKGLQVAIIGDIYHSRVARSACHLLSEVWGEGDTVRPAGVRARSRGDAGARPARLRVTWKRRCAARM